MIRATEGSQHYWDEWVIYGDESIADFFSQSCLPSENKEYRPQFLFEIVKKNWHQILRRNIFRPC
jgi:hypothetical protein